jgi:prolipoprotein diacylglyceryltransferase
MRNLPIWLTNIFQQTHIRHIYDRIDTSLRVNTNMLAAIGEGLLLFAVGQYLLHRQKKTNTIQSGQIAGTFLLWYSAIRFLLEYLRQDSQAEFIAYFSKSQYFFLLFGCIGLLRLIKICYETKLKPQR